MSASAAIVIPVYKPRLEWYEKIALQQAQKVFRRQPICFIMAKDSDYDYLPAEGWKYQRIYFDSKYFASVDGYNELMLSVEFYQAFDSYDYILIYQLDAFAFSDQLNYFCAMGYDYIGAPWPFNSGHIPSVYGKNVFLYVGNGGFSLRRVKSCIELLQKHTEWVETWQHNEDSFFAYYGKYGNVGFDLAPVNIAYQFSWELYPYRCARKTKGVLPFGCHAWFRYAQDLYVKAFALVGYDLSPFYNLMKSFDGTNLFFDFCDVAYQRLVSRVKNNRNVAIYLPQGQDKDWSIFAIGEFGSMVANRLLSDGVAVEQVYYFDDQQIDLLIAKLKESHGKNNLLIKFQDIELSIELQKYGLQCGKEYQLFWKCYIENAERVLRKMMNLIET